MTRKTIARLFATVMVASLAVTGCGRVNTKYSNITIANKNIDLLHGSANTAISLADLDIYTSDYQTMAFPVYSKIDKNWVKYSAKVKSDNDYKYSAGIIDMSGTYKGFVVAKANDLEKTNITVVGNDSLVAYTFAQGTAIKNVDTWDEQTYSFRTVHGITEKTSVNELADIANKNKFFSLPSMNVVSQASLDNGQADYSSTEPRYACLYVDGKQVDISKYYDDFDRLVQTGNTYYNSNMYRGYVLAGGTKVAISAYQHIVNEGFTGAYASDEKFQQDLKNTYVLEFALSELSKDLAEGRIEQAILYDYNVQGFGGNTGDDGKYAYSDTRIWVRVVVFQQETREILSYIQ